MIWRDEQLPVSVKSIINKISQWIRKNKLHINGTKTRAVSFSDRFHLSINLEIDLSGCAKMLGLTIDINLYWRLHIIIYTGTRDVTHFV